MQLKRIGLAVSSAALALWFVGCGPDDGTPPTGCAACATNEICHPVEKVCVRTCSAGADCPDSAKDCGTLVGVGVDGGTTKVCRCATDQLCKGGSLGSSAVCSVESKVCVVACSTDAACGTGRKCENGQCKTAATTCSPACAGTQVCDTSASPPACVNKCGQGTCGTGKVCNFATGVCEAPKACVSTNPQPDACTYGQFCSGTSCSEVAKAACSGFTGSTHGISWGPGKNGAVIHNVLKESYTVASGFCSGAPGPNRYKAKIEAYDPAGGFPAGSCTNPGAAAGAPESSMRAKLHLVDPQGNEVTSGAGDIQCVNTTNGGKNTVFYVNFCSTSTSGYTAALHFVDGNEVCSTISAN
ncbi:MAG: hypothetical protein HYZ28_25965 [Myxococcales bacterium]|nr:hypothetical protein [Myxococcales bacterium]